MNIISDAESKYCNSDYFQTLYKKSTNDEENSSKEITDKEFSELVKKISNLFDSYTQEKLETRKNYNRDSWTYHSRLENWNSFFSKISVTNIYKEFQNKNDKTPKMPDSRTNLNSIYSKKYGYDFMPKIMVYDENKITNNDLNSDYDSIEENSFFTALFKSIDVDVGDIKKAHKEFESRKSMSVLKASTKRLNEKLKLVSYKFNQLYYLDKSSYSFEIDLQEQSVYFCLYKGGQGILIDYQSTGFRWFFNLFFNLLNSTELNSGDIIIMDEPATNLHVKGQRELRIFLKEFAIKNDITIVIVTHSPFLVDLDYLDELRIIENEDNISRIKNVFSAVDSDEPDSLLPIKESLTVESHVLVNPENKVVFVEGITDYNYLTAFKKMFINLASNKDDKKKFSSFVFLPINGVGKTDGEYKKISLKLKAIRSDAAILVDGDEAGKRMKDINKDSDFLILSLSDVDSSFKTIESLFIHEDLENSGLLDENGKFIKHASTSTVFKNQILKNKDLISDTTKNNFRKLFDKFEQELN